MEYYLLNLMKGRNSMRCSKFVLFGFCLGIVLTIFSLAGCHQPANDSLVSERRATLSEKSVRLKDKYDSIRDQYGLIEKESMTSLVFTSLEEQIYSEYYEPADYLVIPSVSSVVTDSYSLSLYPGTYTDISIPKEIGYIRIPSVCSCKTGTGFSSALMNATDIVNGSLSTDSDLIFRNPGTGFSFSLIPGDSVDLIVNAAPVAELKVMTQEEGAKLGYDSFFGPYYSFVLTENLDENGRYRIQMIYTDTFNGKGFFSCPFLSDGQNGLKLKTNHREIPVCDYEIVCQTQNNTIVYDLCFDLEENETPISLLIGYFYLNRMNEQMSSQYSSSGTAVDLPEGENGKLFLDRSLEFGKQSLRLSYAEKTEMEGDLFYRFYVTEYSGTENNIYSDYFGEGKDPVLIGLSDFGSLSAEGGLSEFLESASFDESGRIVSFLMNEKQTKRAYNTLQRSLPLYRVAMNIEIPIGETENSK